MRSVPARLDQVRQFVIGLTGGVNESISTMELKPGELISCMNYIESSGPYSGYASCPGYEVFDGTPLASSIPASPYVVGEDTEGQFGPEWPEEGDWDDDLVWTEPGTTGDAAREARRAAIEPIPGQGVARGVWMYQGSVYGVRDHIGAPSTAAKLFQATSEGWVEIEGSGLNPGGKCRWLNARFSAYPTASPMTNQELMYMVDGVSQPISWDGTTIRVIDHASLPSNAAFLPAPVYPTFIGQYENRLFLIYNDQAFFSAVGDPSDMDGVSGAGQIPLGDIVTNVILAPGNALVFIMRNSIKILYGVEGDATADFSFQLKTFSDTAGGLADTAVRMMSDVYFADDRGPTSLKATEMFGDFSARALTVKTQRTFLANSHLVTAAIASRTMSQYRLFFSNGSGIYYTLQNGRVKGAGLIGWPLSVNNVVSGEDVNGREEIYFTATAADGFVYKMDSGTSFNGAEIKTYFTSAYYHYGTPRLWKHFITMSFEIAAEGGMEFNIRSQYDYGDTDLPRNPYRELTQVSAGGSWGQSISWGSFVFGIGQVQRPICYCYGYGTSMAVSIRTSDKHRAQHIVHDITVDYSTHDRRL